MKRRLHNLALALISLCFLLSPIVFPYFVFAESLPWPNAKSDPVLLRKWLVKLDETLAKDGPSAFNYCSKGQLYEWMHDPESAIKQYSLAIKHNPKEARFFTGRARSFRAIEKWKEAISDYNTAVSLGRSHPEVYIGRSLAELALSKYSDAYSDANKAIQIDPTESIAWMAKGNAELELGKANDCVVSLSRAIELNPRKAAFYELRRAAYKKLGDHKNEKRDIALFEQYSKSGE